MAKKMDETIRAKAALVLFRAALQLWLKAEFPEIFRKRRSEYSRELFQEIYEKYFFGIIQEADIIQLPEKDINQFLKEEISFMVKKLPRRRKKRKRGEIKKASA